MVDHRLARGTRRGIYFFLSYAHSVVTGELVGSAADPAVGKFFRDLRRAVAYYADPHDGVQIAFFDQEIPVISDLKAELSEALGLAEVFIPLYSPGYFANAWPMREQEVFRGRLANHVDDTDASGHVIPVLWTPFPSWELKPPGVESAVGLATDIPAYGENGLRALCMLATYRDSYEQVLDRLAQRVVSVAERSPLHPSPAPDLDDVPGQTFSEAAFAVAVLAPQHGPSPLLSLGADQPWRRPFADRQAPPVAQYVASAAEQLGFQTSVLDPGQVSELSRSPGIVIVDPWILTEDDGSHRLGQTFKDLPEWILPLVVLDEHSPLYAESGARLERETMAVLRNLSRPSVDYTSNMEAFRDAIPRIVSKARRRFMRRPSAPPSPGAGRRG